MAFALLILGSLCGGLASAQSGQARPHAVAPNPGGALVVTNSTTSNTITYVDTAVTQRVDNYSTTVVATQNGNQVFTRTFSVPFADATVQAAVTQADAILSGNHATFGTPALTSNSVVQQGSVTPTPPTYTCLDVENGTVSRTVGATTTTTDTTFGPATVNVGECLSDTFTVLAGQSDINVNTDIVYAVPRTITTTNTFLTTKTYAITGTGGTLAAPALSTWAMGGLALLLATGAILLLQRGPGRQAG